MSKEFFRVNRFSACNYTTLGHYNDVNAGTMEHARASLSQGQPRGHPGGQPRGQDVYVVPVWGAPGYDTLTHGTASGTCSGHFNISHAYGANASSCNTRFVERLCTGNLGDIKEELNLTSVNEIELTRVNKEIKYYNNMLKNANKIRLTKAQLKDFTKMLKNLQQRQSELQPFAA